MINENTHGKHEKPKQKPAQMKKKEHVHDTAFQEEFEESAYTLPRDREYVAPAGHRSRRKRKRHSAHPLRAIWNVFTWSLMAVAVLAAIALVGVRLVGLKPFTVLSGSMEPTYKTGSIVYVKKINYQALAVGDPITFMLDENTVATHRIVEVVPDEEEPGVVRYRTKGDNNDAADGGLVHCKNVIGMPVFTIPLLGYAAHYIQNPPGTYVVIAACALLVMLAFLPDLFADGEEKKPRRSQRFN